LVGSISVVAYSESLGRSAGIYSVVCMKFSVGGGSAMLVFAVA
jgi:hypothetical protein